MNQRQSTRSVPQDPRAAGIFRAVFRLTAVSDLYGPDRAIEWAQSLLDDPELLRAFAHSKTPSSPPQADVKPATAH